jgi:hypothetical protein
LHNTVCGNLSTAWKDEMTGHTDARTHANTCGIFMSLVCFLFSEGKWIKRTKTTPYDRSLYFVPPITYSRTGVQNS